MFRMFEICSLLLQCSVVETECAANTNIVSLWLFSSKLWKTVVPYLVPANLSYWVLRWVSEDSSSMIHYDGFWLLVPVLAQTKEKQIELSLKCSHAKHRGWVSHRSYFVAFIYVSLYWHISHEIRALHGCHFSFGSQRSLSFLPFSAYFCAASLIHNSIYTVICASILMMHSNESVFRPLFFQKRSSACLFCISACVWTEVSASAISEHIHSTVHAHADG